MQLTREQALEYHRQMWTDMQKDLGDEPSATIRDDFKHAWCGNHFPNEQIANDCFLCEFLSKNDPHQFYWDCGAGCLLKWGQDDVGNPITCYDDDGDKDDVSGTHYRLSPISEILALPEREDV